MERYALNERAWRAWQCMPRKETGAPPNVRELERSHRLANGQLHKLIHGKSRSPSPFELEKMAAALQVSFEWLAFGRGDPPRAHQQPSPWPGPKKPVPRQPRSKKPRSLAKPA